MEITVICHRPLHVFARHHVAYGGAANYVATSLCHNTLVSDSYEIYSVGLRPISPVPLGRQPLERVELRQIGYVLHAEEACTWRIVDVLHNHIAWRCREAEERITETILDQCAAGNGKIYSVFFPHTSAPLSSNSTHIKSLP